VNDEGEGTSGKRGARARADCRGADCRTGGKKDERKGKKKARGGSLGERGAYGGRTPKERSLATKMITNKENIINISCRNDLSRRMENGEQKKKKKEDNRLLLSFSQGPSLRRQTEVLWDFYY